MIPKVNKDLIGSSVASVSSDEQFMKKIVERIQEENPVLFALLGNIVKKADWEEDRIQAYLEGAVTFYYLLATQDDCDNLI